MMRTFGGAAPRVHPAAFVHDSAEIVGRVVLGEEASVWPLAVLRGDVDRVVVGARSNIQDLCVLHCRERRPAVVGRGVTVGHRVILHGSRIGDGCLVGMGAVVLEATVGPRCLVAAGSLVLAGMDVPAESLVMGSPARVVRRLKPAELRSLKRSEDSYVRLARRYLATSRLFVSRR